ncbi:MAG: polysaccharide biosynthesis/export family protein [Pirellulales bacterium]|nr:polysaccharide biosynthesis/export family protein [Pirellulales bacterium]
MASVERNIRCIAILGLVVCFLGTLTGCRPFDFYPRSLQAPLPPKYEPPNEIKMVSLPEYRIEPPDVLQLNAFKLVPKPPYRVDAYDVLSIKASVALPDYPIYDYYVVDEEGFVNLGPIYGKVQVRGLPLAEVEAAIVKKLRDIIQRPEISVQLARTGGTQQLDDIYLVQFDGGINLKQYGKVHVAGKTLAEARLAIEKQLSQFFDGPQVGVNVAGYNSAKYYIVFEGSLGENVISLPITGKETVLDAIGTVGGLEHATSREIWISRPAPGDFGCEQILPVDYAAITRGASATTNYQLMPGDRLYVAEDGLVAMNNYVGKVISPINQLLGISQLGYNVVGGYQTLGRNYNRQRRTY